MTKNTVLFILAHQDDECGCASHIRYEIAQGNEAHCMYLTQGSVDGIITPTRDNESRKALWLLGLSDAHIHFLGSRHHIPEGIFRHLDSVLEIAWLEVAKIPNLQHLYLMAWEGGHHDHDAAHLIGLRIACRLGLLNKAYQFPFYNGYELRWKFFRMFKPLLENGKTITRKISFMDGFFNLRLCIIFSSQIKTWAGLFLPSALHLLIKRCEYLQPVSIERIQQKPHTGKLLYERIFGVSYEEFKYVTQNFVDTIVI